MQGRSRDEVDAVVSAWHVERPDLDVAPMEVWSRIDRLGQLLDSARKRTFAECGVEPWEFDVLAALRRAGEPYRLSPGQLMRLTHVTSGTMTNRVDRLRSRGLVTREVAPHDRRAAVVGLTDAGRALVDAALSALLDLEQELLEGWSDADREELAGLLRRMTLALVPDQP